MDITISSNFDRWNLSFSNASDPEANGEFEELLMELLTDSSSFDKLHLRMAHLEKIILTRMPYRPSRRQKARYWFYAARLLLAEGRIAEAFESLALCKRELLNEEMHPLLQLHTFLVYVAQLQGHVTQTVMSSKTTIALLQQLSAATNGISCSDPLRQCFT